MILYLAYRWAAAHPERLRREAERMGGERIRAFIRSPAGHWLGRRVSPRTAYGLALTAGLALIGFFSWVFGAVVEDVVAREPLVGVDVAVLRYFHSYGEPFLTSAIIAFEALFSPTVLLSAAVAIGSALVVLAYRRKAFEMGFPGTVLLATAIGTGVLSDLFKMLLHRPGPLASLQLVYQHDYVFPNLHAMAAVALGAAVWYLWSLRPEGSWVGSRRAKAGVGLAAISVMLLVGVGRVYEGAAYPSDVLAGWALGGLWASVCLTSAEVFRRLWTAGEALSEAGVQYARFSLVGASNALVDLGTMNLLLLIWPTRGPTMLVLYNLVALTITNANSYLWNTLWTFKRRSRHGAKQVGMFAAQAAISVGVSTLVLWVVAHGLAAYANLPPLVGGNMAKLSSMLVGSTTSFFLLRYLVFRPGRERRHYQGSGKLYFSPLDQVLRSCRRTGLSLGTKRGTSSQ